MAPDPKPSARYYPAMANIGGDQVLLFGGFDGPNDDETWVYDLSDNTWTKQSPASQPSARQGHAMANIGGDQVLLFGGFDGARDDETWVYDLSANTWTKKSLASKPSARRDHSLARTVGDQVLLFGGNDGARDDETWIYDLSNNSWTKKTPSSKPSARYSQTLAYIGTNLLLLFGGDDGSIDDETWLLHLSIPVPTPKKPAGTIVDRTPKFIWTKEAGAIKYKIQIQKAGSPIFTKNVGTGSCGASTCSYTLPNAKKLGFAAYKWRVKAQGAVAWSAWSPLKSFKVVNPTPNPKTPSGDISDRTPKYVWTKIKAPGVQNYKFQLKKGTKTIYTNLVGKNVCGKKTCSKTPSKTLAYAKYKWRVRSKISGVWSPWSPYKAFTVK